MAQSRHPKRVFDLGRATIRKRPGPADPFYFGQRSLLSAQKCQSRFSATLSLGSTHSSCEEISVQVKSRLLSFANHPSPIPSYSATQVELIWLPTLTNTVLIRYSSILMIDIRLGSLENSIS